MKFLCRVYHYRIACISVFSRIPACKLSYRIRSGLGCKEHQWSFLNLNPFHTPTMFLSTGNRVALQKTCRGGILWPCCLLQLRIKSPTGEGLRDP